MNGSIVAVVASIVLVVSGFVAFGGREGPQGASGPQGPRGEQGLPGVSGKDIEKFGAAAGPDRDFACESVNGVRTCYASQGFTATSSVLCAMRPLEFSATSTIRRITVAATGLGSLGTAQRIDISTTSQSVGYGSSTPALVVNKLLDGYWPVAWPTLNGTSTLDVSGGLLYTNGLNGESLAIFKPNEWVTVRVATPTPRTLSTYATGKCTAVFDLFN